MEQIISVVLLWLLLGLFLAWRLHRCAKRLQALAWEISYVVFYIVGTVMIAVLYFLPQFSRGVNIAILAVYILVSGFITYRMNQRYEAWRQEQLRKKENEERANRR